MGLWFHDYFSYPQRPVQTGIQCPNKPLPPHGTLRTSSTVDWKKCTDNSGSLDSLFDETHILEKEYNDIMAYAAWGDFAMTPYTPPSWSETPSTTKPKMTNTASKKTMEPLTPDDSPTMGIRINDLRNTSGTSSAAISAHNALMRQMIDPFGTLDSNPVSCRAVSHSRWRHFSKTSSSTRSRDDMTAENLCRATGLEASYNPPILERCDLSVPQKPANKITFEEAGWGGPRTGSEWNERSNSCKQSSFARDEMRTLVEPGSGAEKPKTRSRAQSRTKLHHKFQRQTSSEPTKSTAAISFTREMPRTPSTKSLLTLSLESKNSATGPKVDPNSAMRAMGVKMGIERLCIDDLPEDAFESDSEDED